jgi:hypothetical protein
MIGLGIVFLLLLLPIVLVILTRESSVGFTGAIAGTPPPLGLPQYIIWWGLLVGGLSLGVAVGIGLLGVLFRRRKGAERRIAVPMRVRLLILLGTVSLAVYVVNFLLPFPLTRYYNARDLNFGKIAGLDAGMALGVTAAILALFLLYYLAYRVCRAQNGSDQHDYRLWAVVLIGALAFALVNAYVCTTNSLDIYDYIARGRITAFLGGNPYDKTQTPNAYMTVDPFMQYASWKDKTAAYGPLWEVLSGLISYGAGDKLLANMLAHKGLALASYLLCILIIAVTLRCVSPNRAIAGTLLFAWNPLILMEGLANAHNDLLMVALILAAFWFVSQAGRSPDENETADDHTWHLVVGGFAILMVWMGILVKFIPFLLLPPFFLYTLSKERSWRRWIGLGLLLLTPPALLTLQYYRVFWIWPDVLDPILRRADMFRFTIPSVVVSVLEWQIGKGAAQRIVGRPFLIAFALAYLILLARTAYALYGTRSQGEAIPSPSRHRLWGKVSACILGHWETGGNRPWQVLVGACLGAFLLYLLLASLWFWPWYLSWPIALLALSDDERLVVPLALAGAAGQLAHVGLDFVWYWSDALTWETLYAVERPATLLMVIPPLLAYTIARWPPPARPRPVRYAVYLLYASIIVGFTNLTLDLPDVTVRAWGVPIALIKAVILTILPALAVMISKGKIWARIGTIGLFVLSWACFARSIGLASSVASKVAGIVQIALQVAVIILLILNRSKAWLRPGESGTERAAISLPLPQDAVQSSRTDRLTDLTMLD